MRTLLKKVRMDRKLTQQEVANHCGISRTHYCQIENGVPGHTPSLEVGLKIKQVLKYYCDDIFLNDDVLN